MRDLANNIGAVQAVAPAVLTATNTSAAIDLLGFNGAAVIINTGAIAGSGNFTPKLQESDDGTTFTDVAASDLVGTFPAALVATSVVKVGYIGNRRYVRTVLTLNSGTSVAASAVIVKGRAASKPVA
ncbi:MULTISPECIES: hypothetical protein [unclassified Mesorhizobium]|uniref:hypothetical protein n=1 Tax=unclassified Mesorhizobium TaxID=325217 RepID=UPI001128BC21|nr:MULTISPECIES: hypothetical protein [unclassified Mesorhizobium]TPJ47239.1 hypothetical protein FJ437_10070 [Mesorhizobium sp. B2-6-6]MBZ9999639.1 hypothetical protein [Mesorhizobium sp. B264B2A]MCA0008113.1 hypothetical protein [Mesorhizobium sp. B264B1B]MCA0018013.1 hypothetical protein [Mesorhizobium sp. B264B1A]TPJ52881.1 hypothetical protein FJ462_33295 [Mesorhizobium sp. B2-6-7]